MSKLLYFWGKRVNRNFLKDSKTQNNSCCLDALNNKQSEYFCDDKNKAQRFPLWNRGENLDGV